MRRSSDGGSQRNWMLASGELADTLAARRAVVSGHLRVVAPLGFGRRYVAPLRRDFVLCIGSHSQFDAIRPAGSLAEDAWI